MSFNPAARPHSGQAPTPVPAQNDGSPLQLRARDWKASIKAMVKSVQEDRITIAGAGMAFYFFLAVFPSLIAVVGVLNLLNAGSIFLNSLTDTINRSMPGAAGDLLITAIKGAQESSQGASLAAAIIGVLVALWGATSGMVALQAGLDIAYDVPKERKFLGKRLFALVLVVATGILGALPAPLFAAKGWYWSVAGWIVTMLSITTLFAIFYYLGPNREKPSWKWITPGGLLGGVMFLIASGGFSFYVGNFAKYADTYGSLAGVVVLIFWLYLSALSILIGGELNASLERRTAKIEGQIKA